jgi:RNA recognition motif-containing protein
MPSELQKKLAARREATDASVFESQQEPSTADCARVSPRHKTNDDKQGAVSPTRVASPQRERPRRPSNQLTDFKETMVKRRSLTDSKAPVHESTPNSKKSPKKKSPDKKSPADRDAVPEATPEESFVEEPQFQMTIEEDVAHVDSDKPEDACAQETGMVAAPVDSNTPEDACAQETEMVVPTDPACKVYIGNLSWKTRFKALKAHMAKSGGEIAFTGILGDDGTCDGYGWSRGFGFVIYETPEEAKEAVKVMHGTELEGRQITVDFWSSEEESGAQRTTKTWSQEKGTRWKPQYKDDWYWNMFAQMTGQSWGHQRQRHLRSKRGDAKVRAWVGNINYRANWKDLKNHMEPAGDVAWAEIMTRGGFQGSKSKGSGFVEYKTPEQVEEAVSSLNGTEMKGRQIVVDHWTTRSGSKGAKGH